MSALLDAILGFGSGALDVLDMPGSYARGALAGQFGERLGGREMLEEWGVLGENEEGLDTGDVAGFGVDVVVDPLNLIGLGLAGKTARGAKAAKASNQSSEAMRAAGAMPEEIAAVTKMVDDSGRPVPYYASELDTVEGAYPLMRSDQAGDLSKNHGLNPKPQKYFVDARNPLDMNRPLTKDEFSRMSKISDQIRKDNLDDLRIYDPASFMRAARKKEFAAESLHDAVADAKRIAQSNAEFTGHDVPGAAIRGRDLTPGPLDNYTAGGQMEAFRRLGVDALIDGDFLDRVLNRGMIYAGEIAPALQNVPRVSPIVAALLAHNAGKGVT